MATYVSRSRQYWVLSWLEGYFREHSTNGPFASWRAAHAWATGALHPDARWRIGETPGEEIGA